MCGFSSARWSTARGVVAVCGFAPAARDAAARADARPYAESDPRPDGHRARPRRCPRGLAENGSLEANEKLRSTLLASLSHDLRTPLASIIGAVTTLQQFEDYARRSRPPTCCTRIEEEAGRLTRFIANLLDMSRIEAGALKPKQEIVDIADVVQAAVERARKAFPHADVPDQPCARSAFRRRAIRR